MMICFCLQFVHKMLEASMMICFRLQFTHRILKKTPEASHDDLFCLQFTHTIYMYALSAKEPCK